MTTVIIHKLNLAGRETFAYPGTVIAQTPGSITVEAIFTRDDRLDLGYTTFERGDRFVEHFYADRWYNVFEIHAVGSDALRGWYCNITRPASIEDGHVRHIDLALDVWVNPDGSTQVLDEEEFAALPLSAEDREQARRAVTEIQTLAAQGAAPFQNKKTCRGRKPRQVAG